jgi:hypothetical protein
VVGTTVAVESTVSVVSVASVLLSSDFESCLDAAITRAATTHTPAPIRRAVVNVDPSLGKSSELSSQAARPGVGIRTNVRTKTAVVATTIVLWKNAFMILILSDL